MQNTMLSMLKQLMGGTAAKTDKEKDEMIAKQVHDRRMQYDQTIVDLREEVKAMNKRQKMAAREIDEDGDVIMKGDPIQGLGANRKNMKTRDVSTQPVANKYAGLGSEDPEHRFDMERDITFPRQMQAAKKALAERFKSQTREEFVAGLIPRAKPQADDGDVK
ncbi:MAG: hypothetical protein V4671_28415 [Armatimonadota bacterium]